MSTASPAPEPPATDQPAPPAPQTLSDFQQQLAAGLIASQKAFSEQLVAQQQQFAANAMAAMEQAQAKMQAQTADLMQSFMTGVFVPPAVGGSGQPQTASAQPAAEPATAPAKPAAPAGPT